MSSDNENALPRPPTRLASPFSFSTASQRKRSRGADSGNSSDVPFFSSDDLADASLDNYVSPRRKKQYRRNWWDMETPQTARKPLSKRQAKRVVDSGVFLSSDSSSSNEDGFTVEQLRKSQHKRPDTRSVFPKSPELISPLHGEEKASEIIFNCLELNKATVDLSALHLSSISGHVLRPLRELISVPKVQHHTDIDEGYQSLVPKLQLTLSNNSLSRIPGQLVNLENLTVLSLRNNQITQLPQSVGKLRNLVELNVACNKLKTLPWELLDLVSNGQLINLNIFPNPLLRPFQSPFQSGSWGFAGNLAGTELSILYLKGHLEKATQAGSTDDEQMRFSWLLRLQETLAERMKSHKLVPSPRRIRNIDGTQRHGSHLAWKKDPIYLDSTAITFFDFDGSVPRSASPAPSALPLEITVVPVHKSSHVTYPRDCQKPRQSMVPSLFELALRACGGALQLSKTEDFQFEDMPESIGRMFSELREVIEEGGKHCSKCQKVYVVPGAEWIEYWHCAPDSLNSGYDELFLPFLRRTCSWICAEEVFLERQNSKTRKG